MKIYKEIHLRDYDFSSELARCNANFLTDDEQFDIVESWIVSKYGNEVDEGVIERLFTTDFRVVCEMLNI